MLQTDETITVTDSRTGDGEQAPVPPLSTATESSDVFVCYAHADTQLVFPEIEWLNQQGLKVWYDEGISAGSNWRSTIGIALMNASHVVFFVSERSLASAHCNREINLALDEGKAIVPVYLEDVELTPDLKVGLTRIQALFLDKKGYRERLLNALTQSGSTTIDGTAPVRARPAHRYVIPSVVAFIVAVIAVYVSTFWSGRPDEPTAPESHVEVESIAVLPFINLSDATEAGHFAKGLADGVLNELAKLDWLRVASRTATFQLAGDGVELKTLAEQLEVYYVLEGSIQMIDDEVRIIAQLIRAGDGFHVWSKTYDRSFAEGFRMQEEVGRNVAQVSSIRLNNDARRQHSQLYEDLVGNDPEAIRYYLDSENEYSLYAIGEGGNVQTALQLMEKAVDIDPEFVAAIEDLAWNYMMRVDQTLSVTESAERAHAFIEKALALNPESVTALFFLAQVHLRLDLDYASAERVTRRGLEIYPEGVWWNTFLAGVASREGRRREASLYMEMDYLRDHGEDRPDWLLLNANGSNLSGDYDGALRFTEEALNLVGAGRRAEVLVVQVDALIGLGRLDEARAVIAEAWRLSGAVAPETFAYFFAATGELERARSILDGMQVRSGNRYHIARGYYALNDHDKVFDILREGIEDRELKVVDAMHSVTIFSELEGDPRLDELRALLASKETYTPRFTAHE